ncbi:MAG: hypothetical protein DRQ88_09365 [Epsilonproteobacteria bacterium]|nr:MAG: hypothetical protein DRQ88_09365 [Campylobacterota bacterium]
MNVPLSEMRDAYSSITKNKELGEEIQEREIEVQKELDDYVEEREEVVGHLEKIGELLDDKEGNPMDAIYYLLDMTGRNRNDYQRKILHHHLEEVESLQMMSDSERKAYFLEQENEYLKERHETSESSVREIEEQKSFVDNMTRQREAQGISEDEFIDAYKDLVNSGETESDLTPETVIQYAKFLPVVIEAEEIVEGFDPDLLDDDEVVRAVADSIVEDPEITKEELIEILEYSFGKMGGETAIKETGEHGESFYKEARPKQKPKESDHLESFDDFGQYGGNY